MRRRRGRPKPRRSRTGDEGVEARANGEVESPLGSSVSPARCVVSQDSRRLCRFLDRFRRAIAGAGRGKGRRHGNRAPGSVDTANLIRPVFRSERRGRPARQVAAGVTRRARRRHLGPTPKPRHSWGWWRRPRPTVRTNSGQRATPTDIRSAGSPVPLNVRIRRSAVTGCQRYAGGRAPSRIRSESRFGPPKRVGRHEPTAPSCVGHADWSEPRRGDTCSLRFESWMADIGRKDRGRRRTAPTRMRSPTPGSPEKIVRREIVGTAGAVDLAHQALKACDDVLSGPGDAARRAADSSRETSAAGERTRVLNVTLTH